MDPKAVVGSPITSDAVVGRTTQIHTADPTAFDDADDGYVIGSRWVNTTLDSTFTCADNTVGSAVWVREDGGSAGATDHGALTGLGDDDHTQYHNDARGDARYAPVAHVGAGGTAHANVVAGGAAGFMSGTDKTKLDGIATGAEVNVNADWNAASGDAQILNKPSSFTPSTHASTHVAAGSDPLTLAQSQITNLTTDLAAKAPLASPTLTGTPAAPTALQGTNTTQIATTAFVNAEIAADAAPLAHVGTGGSAHAAATTSVAGFMSGADKTKLDGIAAGAEVNQNAFSTVAVSGQSDIVADGKTDTLTVAAGANVTLTTNATTDTLTVAVSSFPYGGLTSVPSSFTPSAHASTHQSGGSDAIKLDDLTAPDDNTDLDATTLRHGLLPKLGGGTSNFLRADGSWAAPAGGGGSSVWWAQIANGTAISITAATTATIERMHEVSLTSADATVTLPTAVGNSGKCIGIKVLSTNTKSVTIDGNSTETIDGSTTLNMHKNGTLLVRSDGANWYSLVRELAPSVHVEASSDAGQSVTADTTNLQYEDEAVDMHGAWATDTFTCPVAGVYLITATASFTTSAITPNLGIYKNGAIAAYGANRTAQASGTASLATAIMLSAGDTITVRSTSTSARGTLSSTNRITITRIGD